ncbi:hypothetical protein C0J52_07224 [Blattella germanica]|nr:hypothetical protein C0J52_07224 [Blattella germanica]
MVEKCDGPTGTQMDTAIRLQHSKINFIKSEGTAGDEGVDFKLKILSLVFLRGIAEEEEIRISANFKESKCFNDGMYQHGNSRKTTFFIHIKHKRNERPITVSHLFKDKKTDYSLFKFFESYVKLRKIVKENVHLEDCKFILCTNRDIKDVAKLEKKIAIGSEKSLLAGGSILQFSKETLAEGFKTSIDSEDLANKDKLTVEFKTLTEHDDFEGFLRQFYIVFKQDIPQVEEHIKDELKSILKVSNDDIDKYFIIFSREMKNWWSRSKEFLTKDLKGTPLEKTGIILANACAQQQSKFRKEDLRSLDLEFEIPTLKEMINVNDSREILIKTPVYETAITALKVDVLLKEKHGSDNEHCIYKMEHFMEYRDQILKAWKHLQFKVLVIEIQHLEGSCREVLREILEILKLPDSQVIFIAQWRGNLSTEIIRQECSSDLKTINDRLSFHDFGKVTQDRILANNYVSFEGYPISLRKLLNKDNINTLTMQSMQSDFLAQLVMRQLAKVGSPLQYYVPYYIERTLQQEYCVKDSIFREEGIVLALSGSVNKPKLSMKRCVSFDKWGKNNSHRYVLVENIEQFICICKKQEHVVWLERTDGVWLCKQWQGNVNIRAHLERHKTPFWKPTTLLDSDIRVIVVVDDPGKGKSTLLSHLSRNTKEKYPHYWIVRININEYSKQLENLKTNFQENEAINILRKAVGIRSGISIDSDLFEYSYTSMGNMIVIIDGVDEVCPKYFDEVVMLVKFLLTTKIEKVWLTSRPFIQSILENKLSVIAHSLLPFHESDQRSFLKNFWKQSNKNLAGNIVEAWVSEVIRLTKQQFNDEEKEFMGIPLQCLLLAEYFEPKLQSTSKMPDVVQLDLHSLYNSYFEKKWQIYEVEKKRNDLTNVGVRKDGIELRDNFFNIHMKASLLTVFSSEYLRELHLEDSSTEIIGFLESIKNGINKTGIILNVKNGIPVFEHRTFAEFFVATFFYNNLEEHKYFLRIHIMDEFLTTVRKILDRMLTKDCPLHQAVLNVDSNELNTRIKDVDFHLQKDKVGRTPFHLAVSNGLSDIAGLLLQTTMNAEDKDPLLELSPVELAIKMNNFDILGEFLDKIPNLRFQYFNEKVGQNLQLLPRLVILAARRGLDNLLHYFVHRGLNSDICLLNNNSSLMHEAARNRKVKTLETLVKLGGSIYVTENGGKIPLHICCELGHLDVVRALVSLHQKNSSFPESQNQKDETSEVDSLFEALNSSSKRNDFQFCKDLGVNVCDTTGNTPLHLAAKAGQCEVIRYLNKCSEISLERTNQEGKTALILAASAGRSAAVSTLLALGSEITCDALAAACGNGHLECVKLLLNGIDSYEMPLLYATHNGHLEIIKLLVKNIPSRIDINKTLNSRLESPLFVAVQSGHVHIVEYYIENGAHIEAETVTKERSLHSACQFGHYEITKILISYGAEINCTNSNSQTPLYLAAKSGHESIVKLLILSGADISVRSDDDSTALHVACKENHPDVIELLIDEGGNIHDKDENMYSCLHYAAKSGNLKLIKSILYDDLVSEDESQYNDTLHSRLHSKANDKRTPLELAAINGDLEIIDFLIDIERATNGAFLCINILA